MKTKLFVALVACLFAGSSAFAGGVLVVTPSGAGPYQQGEVLDVSVSLTNTELVSVDLLTTVMSTVASDPALAIGDTFTWDTSTLADDSGYAWFDAMPTPSFLTGPGDSEFLSIGAGESLLLGTFTVTLPMENGDYLLDVINVTDGGGISGSANILREGALFADTWAPRDGSMLGGTAAIAVVPEPATLVLALSGMLAFGVPRFAKRRR